MRIEHLRGAVLLREPCWRRERVQLLLLLLLVLLLLMHWCLWTRLKAATERSWHVPDPWARLRWARLPKAACRGFAGAAVS
jgi:hypothetical protein